MVYFNKKYIIIIIRDTIFSKVIICSSESLVIFSGGLPSDKAGRTHSITVLNGKSTTVLEMEHSVVDFVTLCETPHTAGKTWLYFFIQESEYAILAFIPGQDLSTGIPTFQITKSRTR